MYTLIKKKYYFYLVNVTEQKYWVSTKGLSILILTNLKSSTDSSEVHIKIYFKKSVFSFPYNESRHVKVLIWTALTFIAWKKLFFKISSTEEGDSYKQVSNNIKV